MPPKRSKSTGTPVLPATPRPAKKTSIIDELPPELAEFALRRSERIKCAVPRTPGENKRRATSPILTSPAHGPPTKKARDEEEDEKNPEDYDEYVADIPLWKDHYDGEDRDELIWSPPERICCDAENLMIESYVDRMTFEHDMSKDRALYILHQNDYDIEAAEKLIESYSAPCSQWTDKEAKIFLRGFHMYGKRFHKIGELLPEKSMREIINRYYDTKKEDNLSKVAKSIPADECDFGDSEDDGPTSRGYCFVCSKQTYLYHSDGLPTCKKCRVYKQVMGEYGDDLDLEKVVNENDDKKVYLPAHEEFHTAALGIVGGIELGKFNQISEEEFDRLKKDEVTRVTNSVIRHNATKPNKVDMDVVFEKKRAAHGFFFLNQEKPPTRCATDTMALKVKGTETMLRCKAIEAGMDIDMVADVNLGKVEEIKAKMTKSLKQYLKNKEVKVSDEWTNKEKLCAAKAFCRYGFNFEMVAGIVETKTAEDVKAFYTHNKKHFDEQAAKRAQKKMDEAAKQLKIMNDAAQLLEDTNPAAEQLKIMNDAAQLLKDENQAAEQLKIMNDAAQLLEDEDQAAAQLEDSSV